MAHGQFHAELRQLRTMLAGPMTDADLLHRFVEKRDEAAFAVLVRRHGSLVLQVCRSVLRQDADADDAFQATFLVLARKAGSFRKGMSLASWLHGVAYRCSMNLRKSAMRRQAREKAAAGGRSPESSATRAAWNELQACLHEEVQRLPAAVRAVFVLCVLEDKGRAEAARALGCPEGTLASRLARARTILQKRLTARGVTLSAALSAAAIATGAASASATLVHETTTAALAFAAGNAVGAVSAKVLALAERVLQGMLLTKAKLGAMLMIAVLLGVVAGGSLVAQPNGSDIPAKKAVAPNPAPQAANEKPEARSERPAQFDSRGDALPEAALVRLGSARMRHGGKIYGSELSPDGKTLATAGENSVILWDLDSGKVLRRLSCDRIGCYCTPGLAFSPDGSHLAYLRTGTFGCIWDLRTGKEIHRFEAPREDKANVFDRLGSKCAFAKQGKELLYGSNSAVLRFDLESKQVIDYIPVQHAGLFSPDGKTIFRNDGAATLNGGGLTLFDAVSGNALAWLEVSAHSDGIENGLACSPDGKTFAVVHGRREIQHRELPGGRLLASFPLPKSAIHLFPPNPPMKETYYEYRLAFSADGRTLLLGTSQGMTHRWDLASGKELPALDKGPAFVAGAHVLPGGGVVTAADDGNIRKWDFTAGKRVPEPDSYEGKIAAAYSDDGRFAAIGDGRGRVDLRDPRSGKVMRTLQREGPVATHLAFSPDGNLLALAESSGAVRFWRIPSGEAAGFWEHKPSKHEWYCNGIHFSPDGRSLSISDFPNRLRLVEIATGNESWARASTYGEAFSPDGAMLFVAAPAGANLSLLDAKTGRTKSKARLEPEAGNELGDTCSIAVSPDGRSLAAIYNGGCLSLCDGRTGETKHRLHSYNMRKEIASELLGRTRNGAPRSVAFSADGRWLASGGSFGGITIWDVAAGEEVLRLPGHEAEVTALAFSPDGRTLNSFGADGQGYRWNLEPKADGRRASFAELWDALDHAKPADAYRAQWRMIADPKGSAAFLRDRLKPIPTPDAGKVRKWIADLDSDVFTVREAASRELTKIGERVQTPIREALKKGMPAESHRRLTQVLATVSNAPNPESVRTVRAIMILERIGSSEARGVLETMSRGAPGTRATEEAAAALQRLDKVVAQDP